VTKPTAIDTTTASTTTAKQGLTVRAAPVAPVIKTVTVAPVIPKIDTTTDDNKSLLDVDLLLDGEEGQDQEGLCNMSLEVFGD
jgi:hypothetical protein